MYCCTNLKMWNGTLILKQARKLLCKPINNVSKQATATCFVSKGNT